MKRSIGLSLTLVVIGSMLLVAVASAQGGTAVSRGGLLYDKWWTITGAEEPTTDHPLWATQSTNTASGADTWRCKECHGWDYKGKDGAYGSGSHFTGFPGVYDAQSKSVDELVAALKGATNPDHDFSTVMDDEALTDLATFLKEGLVDAGMYVDYTAKAPLGADADHGQQLFDGLCAACHGADGTTFNFGTDDEPEYIGTLSNDNPWEFLHKARFGHPGSNPPMPSTIDLGWSMEDAVDALAYAQTLPTGEEAPAALPATGANTLPWTSIILLAAGLLMLGLGLGMLASQVLRHAR